MEMTNKLKSRFVKDYDLPIKIYQEPYFTDRLILFDKMFNTISKWELFEREVSTFQNEQDYFQYYNETKNKFIDNIKLKPEYAEFNSFDMNQYRIPNYQIGRKSVFKEDNIGKRLISIDLSKANYYTMRFFNKNLVDNTNNYSDFISQFTDLQHIIESKYIRQVIFGNCNPKRQVTIEKYMMNFVMEILLKHMDIKYIQTFSDDEIVIEYFDGIQLQEIYDELDNLEEEKDFKLHYEDYALAKIPNTDYYVKHLDTGEIKFKCVNNLFYPFIIRAYNNEEIQESDLVFHHEGYLSKFIEIPKIEVV